MEVKDYAELAAKWWSNKIRSIYNQAPIRNLDFFERILMKKIQILSNTRGSVIISTYKGRCKLLDEISTISKLPVDLPTGYEMKIIIGSVYVYDSKGTLVANF